MKNSFFYLTSLGLMTGAVSLSCGAPATAQDKTGWADKNIPAWPEILPAAALVVKGETDIKWAPVPYVFEAGTSPRYIDYETGDDTRAGTSTATAWKHHPWDSNATGKAKAEKGSHTYIFKGGVSYRGMLEVKESGTAGAPIKLARDPKWGDGPATIAGSEEVKGWTKLSDADAQKLNLPAESKGKVWVAPFSAATPRALWIAKGAGERQRMTLARWPNWKIEHPYNHFTQWFRVENIEAGMPFTKIIAPKVLKGVAPADLQGSTIWVDMPNKSLEFGIMGPVPSSVTGFDSASGSLKVELNHPVRLPTKNSPFYFENKANFLDEAGEWFFDKASKRMLVRLPAEADPNGFKIEAAARDVTLNIVGQKFIEIAGLTFTGGNVPDLNKAVDNGRYKAPERTTEMAAIRLEGDCRNISLHHLVIEDTGGSGIANIITNSDDVVRNIEISDNRFTRVDNDGIVLNRGFPWRDTVAQPKARLTQVNIWRNSMFDIGMRSSVPQGGLGINMIGLEVGDIAGNVMERIRGQGINMQAGRPAAGWLGDDAAETPLVRVQIRQNKVKEALMYRSDFGSIELWDNGPVYVYNNLSINPIGWNAHRNQYVKNEAFYSDHGMKGYFFNNIGWSARREDAYRNIVGSTFFNEIRTRSNIAFHNTSADFRVHYTNVGAHGDLNMYVGNLMMNASNFIGVWQFRDAMGSALSRNLGAGHYTQFYNRFRGESFTAVEGFREAFASEGNMVARDGGLVSDVLPVVDEKNRDFRLTDTSPAIDRGVKMWVPWGLYGVVGEWNFRLSPESPNKALADDMYAQKFNTNGSTYHLDGPVPTNDLDGQGFTTADYEQGILEDWNQGAVKLDGTKTFRLPHAKLIQDFKTIPRSKVEVEFKGTDRKTVNMDANNFLIETVMRTSKAGGTIAAKMEGASGYSLGLDAQGNLELKMNGATLTGSKAVNDGVWHHVLVEVDRAANKATFYVDGVAASPKAAGAFPAAGASLANGADFVVGAGFAGELDFLRVARGTLADALTDINQLMSWQFNGPQNRDFVGRAPTGGIRDIGALEHPTISRVFPVVYTPPAGVVKVAANTGAKASEDGDEFLDGPTRKVKAEKWGSISVPKTAKPGETVKVQVTFATESVDKEQMLHMDFHGFIDGKRKPGMGAAKPIKVTPGVTTPFTVGYTIPEKAGLARIEVIVYVTPDGTYSKKTLSGVATIDVTDKAPAAATNTAKANNTATAANNGGGEFDEGPTRMVKTLDWGKVSVPKSVKAGEQVKAQITFNDDSVKEDQILKVELHGYINGKRVPGLGASKPVKVKAGDTTLIETGPTVPRRAGLAKIALIIYASPDGNYSTKTFATEIGIDVTDDAPTTDAQPEAKPDAKPAKKPKAKPAAAADMGGGNDTKMMDDDTREVKTLDWGKVSAPRTVKAGEKFQIQIALNDDKVTAEQILKVELHGFINGKRMPGLGAAKPINLKIGETAPITVRLTVPDKDGLAKVVVVLYGSPDGKYSTKTFATEIGINVEK